MCGNYFRRARDGRRGEGSPPRVRELLFIRIVFVDDVGITPACAGITGNAYRVGARSQDHPRVCGNYSRRRRLLTRTEGSPPRVRELLNDYNFSRLVDRITPACAGIT